MSLLEAPPRFELGRKAFAELCLTTWLWCRNSCLYILSNIQKKINNIVELFVKILLRKVCLKSTLIHKAMPEAKPCDGCFVILY